MNRKTVADYSELVSQWHPTKNGDLRPDEVSRGSSRYIWWQCENGHEWKASANNRTNSNHRRGCRICYVLKTQKRPSREVFLDYYSNHTFAECCKHFDVNPGRIFKWRKHFNVGTKLELRNDKLTLSCKQKQILEGSLLGDGHLSSASKRLPQFRETHCLEQADYVKFKGIELSGFTSNIGEKGSNGNQRMVLETITHPEITALEKQWYKRDANGHYILNWQKHRIKIVPPDLDLTPLIVAIWYCDDGWHSPKRRQAWLCTNSFSEKEVKYLVAKLQGLDISCEMAINHRNEPLIYIGSQSYRDFIKMVSPYITASCMQYKIDLSHYTESQHKNFKPKKYWCEETIFKHLFKFKTFPKRVQLDGSLIAAIKHNGGFKYFRKKFEKKISNE